MKYFYSLLSVILLFSACSSNSDPDPVPPPEKPAKSTQNTVLVYLATDCGFAREAPVKVRTLRDNWSKNYDGNLLIYADEGTSNNSKGAYLIHIYADQYGDNQADTVKKYGQVNSADPDFIKGVMEEVYIKDWPAATNGLLTLSHASGWIPEGKLGNPTSRSVLMDGSNELELWDFAEAIPKKLDYIIFDACLMAGVEVAYELKDKADYIIASPAEVIVDETFIYPTVMGDLLSQTSDIKSSLIKVTEDFYNFFAENPRSVLRYVTVSLINTAGMERLAEVTKEVLRDTNTNPANNFEDTDITYLQLFRPNPKLYFDFGQYIETLSDNEAFIERFNDALDKCIVKAMNTDFYYSNYNKTGNKISYYSGMTIYIPQSQFKNLNQDYQDNLQWSKYIWGN